MFTYADLSKTGHDHFLFNTGYFTVLKSIFPQDEVALYCHPSHFNYIREEIDTEGLAYHPVYILQKSSGKLTFLFRWLYKNLYDFFILFRILRRSAAADGKFLFFAMMPVRSMGYLLFWHRLFFRRQQVILTYHGEIEKWFEQGKGITARFHSWIFKNLFAYRNNRLKFFVPNAFIRENLRKEPRFQDKDILTVYHLLNPPPIMQKSMSDIPVVLAHIGSTEQRKNSDLFFKLAALIRMQSPELSTKLQFKIAGKYNPIFDGLFNKEEILLSDQQRILDRDYFDDEIATAHFSVIFIYPHEYLYRESGTVLESLKFYKPVIGLRHAYLDFLEGRYGTLGLYADTLEALAEKIKHFFADPEKAAAQYRQMTTNIQNMHSRIALPALSEDLKAQLAATGIGAS